ncbi:hypothetical protein HK102_013830 [Quaeritorhiza haematococci]|nr:hypothetical protein HK102_013830 [Quaeritorhiza haematococci]
MSSERAEDYYEILGLERTATDDEIKRAYRKEALKWHPDKNPDNRHEAEVRFKLVAEAYEVLRDSDKRAVYDRYGAAGLRNGGAEDQSWGAGGGRGFHFRTAEEIFREFFGHHDPFASAFQNMHDPFMSPFGQRSAFGAPFAAPFGSMFGGGFGSPFGAAAHADPFGFYGGGGGGSSSNFTTSSFSSFGGMGSTSTSTSTQTVFVNGQRRSVTTKTTIDENGNTTTETITQDGQGNVQREITVNGVRQQLLNGSSQGQTQRITLQ